MIVLEYILLVGVIVCAIAAPLCKRLLASVTVYMALIPDDGGAVEPAPEPGSGHYGGGWWAPVWTSILFFLTLKKIHALKGTRDE